MHPCSIESTSTGFVCGLYELSEDSQYRNGAVVMYSMDGDVLQKLDLDSGILDLKFSGTKEVLGCALSSSKIAFCGITADGLLGKPCELALPDEGLTLSLSWSDTNTPEAYPKLATSSQSSTIHILAMREGGVDMITKIDNAHQLLGESVPTWVVAYDIHNMHIVASGGDDNSLKLWDIRNRNTVAVNKKSHTAGVTSVRVDIEENT